MTDGFVGMAESFGLTDDEINTEYCKYGEPIGMEGKARAVLLEKVIRSGWIRLRRYPNRKWSVTVGRLDASTLIRIKAWGVAILEGVSGVKEADPYMPVVITEIIAEQETTVTVNHLVQYF